MHAHTLAHTNNTHTFLHIYTPADSLLLGDNEPGSKNSLLRLTFPSLQVN